MITKKVRQYTVIVAFISFGMGILIHFNNILALLAPDGNYDLGNIRSETFTHVFGDVLASALIAFFTFIVNYYIIKPLDGMKRLTVKQVILSIVLTLVSVYLLSDLFFALKHFVLDVDNHNKFVLLYFFRDIFRASVVLIFVYMIKVFYEKQGILFENEKLMLENLQSQYQSLKNQVSPHFLFNSLTALKELIDDDPGNARKYVSHLSLMLRYTLQSNENQTVCLADEIDSVNSYLFLIKMRFGENLKVDFKIDESYRNHRLPPMVIQTLIENAVKHNEVSKRNTLIIKLRTTENHSLVVSNTLRERITREPGTGIGLVNLSKQYQLLSSKEITISKGEDEFKVEVPLLKPNSNESNNS